MEPSVRGPKSVVVVGGGLIGLTTSLLLAERGAEVTIIDSGELGGGAARGNAGFMCTTLLEPLAAPGAMRSALGSLRDPLRPLRVHPRALPGMARWGLHFARSTTKHRYVAGRTALARVNQRSAEAIGRLADLGVALEPGPTLVVPFKDPSVAAHHLSTLAPMADFGITIPDALLDGDELRREVPALGDAINAGYILAGDHSIDPRVFVDSMIAALRDRRVTIAENSPVTSVRGEGRRVVSVSTAHGIFTTDEVILAPGAGLREVAGKFGVRVEVVPGQGYNVGLPTAAGLTHPVIFEEAHAVATPFADRIRLGGTMEFDGDHPRFDRRRVDAVIDSLRTLVNLDFTAPFDAWAGSRPMSPDGLPLLGRPNDVDNLVIAGGHGMFGLSLAPVTALAISELVVDGHSPTDLTDFHPERFTVRRLVG